MTKSASKTAMIYGSTSGLGWELAKLLYEFGWNVCCFGRRAQRLLGFKTTYCASQSGRCLIFEGDITQEECVNSFTASALQKYTSIDLIIVCSGVYGIPGKWNDNANFRNVMETNFWGAYNVVMASLNHFRNSINHTFLLAISSSLAHRAAPGSAPYTVSKAAVLSLIDALRVEIGGKISNVSIDVIEATPFCSEMNRESTVSARDAARGILNDVLNKINFTNKGGMYESQRNRTKC